MLFSSTLRLNYVCCEINEKFKLIRFQKIPCVKYFVSYVQGQSPEPKIREYFYYIDHQGMLFLDDAKIKNFTSCFKDKQFLVFFFQRLRINDTGRYLEFPYISLCGREKNYVRCDDQPIVFTHVININNEDMFCYNHTSDHLKIPFEPNKIYMHPSNGRVYHPGPEKTGSVGLVMSKLAIEFSKFFIFKEGPLPTHFIWKDVKYELDSCWFKHLNNKIIFKNC